MECLTNVPGPRYRHINCSSMPDWQSPRFQSYTTFWCYSIFSGRACFFEASQLNRLDAALASFLADADETVSGGGNTIGQLLAPASSDDVLIVNAGFHQQFEIIEALPHLRTALHRAAELSAHRRRKHGAAPHLLWRQSTPQHFPGTLDGAFPTSDKRFAKTQFFRAHGPPPSNTTSSGCVPLPAAATDANRRLGEPPLTQPVVDRMDPIVRAAAGAANDTTRGAIIIPAWWACRDRANDHMGRWRLDHVSYDCTHFCEGCAAALNPKLSGFHASCAVDAPPSSCLDVLARLTLAYVAREVLCADRRPGG